MADVESESSVFDVPPIDSNSSGNYGKNYDGAIKESAYRHGVHYTTKEIVLLGGGEEDVGLQMIGDSILVEMDMIEEVDTYRPYDDDIDELVNDYWIH